MPHRCEMPLLQRAQVAPRLGRHPRRDLLHQHPGAAEAIRGHDGSLSSPGHVRRRDLYRPKRGPFSSLAIWTSHREVAREALRRGQARILVLEDDLNFLRPWDSVLESIRKAVTR